MQIARAQPIIHFGKSDVYFLLILEKLEVQAPNVYKGQHFWVRATFLAGPVSYNQNNFSATIELPEGFSLKEGETYSHPNPAIQAYGYWSTEWVVIAPNKIGIYTINVSVDSVYQQKKSVTIIVTPYPVNPVIEIRGTEYQSGEYGIIYAQIKDSDGTPINLANCTIKIFYPNETLWIEDKLKYLFGSDGLYYYNFIVPQIEGVYAVTANCSEPLVYGFSTFHVTKWLNKTLEKVEEVKSLVDSLKDDISKIPGINTLVNTISYQLQSLGVSVQRCFVLSVLILSVFITAGIIVSLHIAKSNKKEEGEVEWF